MSKSLCNLSFLRAVSTKTKWKNTVIYFNRQKTIRSPMAKDSSTTRTEHHHLTSQLMNKKVCNYISNLSSASLAATEVKITRHIQVVTYQHILKETCSTMEVGSKPQFTILSTIYMLTMAEASTVSSLQISSSLDPILLTRNNTNSCLKNIIFSTTTMT
jgi:hypothetical protein